MTHLGQIRFLLNTFRPIAIMIMIHSLHESCPPLSSEFFFRTFGCKVCLKSEFQICDVFEHYRGYLGQKPEAYTMLDRVVMG